MKKILFSLILLCAVVTVNAQNNAVSKYFKQYQRDTSFTKVSVTSKMFSLFTEIDTDDETEQEILAAMAKLKGIKAFFSDDTTRDLQGYYFDALDLIETDGNFEELMTVEDRRENIAFMIREDANGTINELFMVLGGPNNFMVMSLYGVIDLGMIGKISKALKIRGMENFEQLTE